MRCILIACFSALLANSELPAQELNNAKGTCFVHWGYNRAWYSGSDIHFEGEGYDFTLRHVKAVDRPMPFSAEGYLTPRNIWIPQYNYRVGWFLHHRWSLSLGLDHMKYVVVKDQRVQMDGVVEATRSARYATRGEGPQEVVLSEDLLRYEHTDGLNLLSVDLDHYADLWTSRNARHQLRAFLGIHGGPVIPRSDVRLFGEGINNRFNVAGFGVGAQLGLQITFLEHFFVRNTLRGGWIDLPHVLTTGEKGDRADQHFWFAQHAIVVGGQFRFGRKAAR